MSLLGELLRQVPLGGQANELNAEEVSELLVGEMLCLFYLRP